MVESFIIQIYRRDDAGRALAGTVERVGDGSKQRFSSVRELWQCLCAKPGPRGVRTSPSKRGEPKA
jgi:hypothetical protein